MTAPAAARPGARHAPPARQGTPPAQRVALVDLLDRLLGGGVVIAGDLVISIADVDLVQVSLRALITTVRDDILPDDLPRHGDAQVRT